MNKLVMSDSNTNLVLGPRHGLTPRQTGPLTVDRNFDSDTSSQSRKKFAGRHSIENFRSW
jgi:hypothetical protein